jgi:hypothetical protein
MASDHGVRSSEYWKKRAEESRARADEMPNEEARTMMPSIARMYSLLAVHAAAREGLEEDPD